MLIDVSLKIEPGATFRAGTPPVAIGPQEFYHPSVGGFETTMLHLPAHTATHIDLVYREKSVGLERMIGPGKLINVTKAANREIQVTDLEGQVEIGRGDFVFFRTDWSSFVGTEEYRKHPEATQEVVEWLISRQINMVGIDAPGLGRGHKHTAHDRLLAQKDIFVVENLTNLAAIPSPVFRVYCFPLKLEDVDAIPARVVVETQDGYSR